MSLLEEEEGYVDIKLMMEKEKNKGENVSLLKNITPKQIIENEVTPAKQAVTAPKSYMHLLKVIFFSLSLRCLIKY